MPTAARPKKNNGSFTRFGRHATYFRFCKGRSTGVEDYNHEDSWRSNRCDNANSFLNLDEIMGLRTQQPPKTQVAKKKEKQEKTTTMVTSHTVFPEERIEPEFHYLAHIWGKYLRKVILFLKYGPPHPVKATLKNQWKTQEVPPSNAGFQPWKFLIRNNHQPVRPWSTTTNGANKGGNKAFL